MIRHFQPIHDLAGMLDFAIEDTHPTSSTEPRPAVLHGFGQDGGSFPVPDGSLFGMTTGPCRLVLSDYTTPEVVTTHELPGRSYFAINGRQYHRAVVEGGPGLIIEYPGHYALTMVGGPLEARGRLRYIDGCSDSLIIAPPVIGEPCLNHLHIPEGINQTQHTHPSDRIGIILSGSGECRTPDGSFRLEGGMGWRIPAGGIHSFHTGPGESLDVFAWHPDSDVGPSHDAHPMLTRTIVEGTPASQRPELHSREDAVLGTHR